MVPILLHSARGLQALERDAAERLGTCRHTVPTPDLFARAHAGAIAEGPLHDPS